jgi:hypothetical protein
VVRAATSGAEAQVDRASRLELARGVLRGVESRTAAAEAAAPAGVGPEPDHRVLPVVEPLARLLPAGGLRRGSTVAVSEGPGSTSLLLALLAELSAGGGWIGVVGRPGLGVVAAAEAGIRLERLALVPRPGVDLLAVTSALLDGLDAVVVAGAERAGIRGADRQRLAARARQRGAVLLPLGAWPGADLELSCTDARWHGLDTGRSDTGRSGGERSGGGRLRARQVCVWLRGRGIAPGGLEAPLLLPAPDGGIADGVVDRADQGRADQGRADQGRADQGRADRGGVDRGREEAVPVAARVAG